MSDTPVQVTRLRLRAARDAPVHTLRARVEDALRTSAKPAGLAHRFVMLRRLCVPMPPGGSAQGLARRLEAQWRELERRAVPIQRAADDADAVWAADEVQARLALLNRWLQGRDTRAWFWQRLLPPAAQMLPLPQRALRLLLEPWSSADASPMQAGAMQRALWRAAAPAIVAAGWGAALREACPAAVWVGFGDASVSGHDGELRSLAVQAVPLARSGPAGAAPAWTWAEASEGSAGVAPGPARPGRAGGAPRSGANVAGSAAAAEPSTPARARVRAVAGPAAGQAPDAPAASLGRANGRSLPTPAGQRGADEAEVDGSGTTASRALDGLPTAWAGLWFVLPLALQLRLHDEPDAPRLLAALLRHAAACLPLDQPACTWVAHVADRAGLDEAAAPAPALAPCAAAWWRRMRVQAVQRARLPLRRVLCRPGRVVLSAHRVDVVLPRHAADVRVRRAGFDIDPGYVPWLDLVVRFHYPA